MIDKNKILESTRIAVLVYSFAYIVLTLIYCLPRILVEYTSFDMSHVNENFTFPLDIFAWGLMAVCSVYCGGDRATFTVKSSMMDIGKGDVGNPERLTTVIKILVVIFIESAFLNFYLGHDFIVFGSSGKQEFHGISLPLDGVVTALVSCCILSVTGNGAISIATNVGSKTPTDNEIEKE